MLDDSESVVALSAQGLRIAMLVVGDRMGAVARFDGAQWMPIGEDQVIDATLSDLDWWRGTSYVLDRDGGVWKVDEGPPRPFHFSARHSAFTTENGAPRPLHGVKAFDGGILLASDGGVVAITEGDDPVFHAAVHKGQPSRDPVRLVRAAPRTGKDLDQSGIVALSGPNVWVWRNGNFQVIDMREW
jgi:hypothetical protein